MTESDSSEHLQHNHERQVLAKFIDCLLENLDHQEQSEKDPLKLYALHLRLRLCTDKADYKECLLKGYDCLIKQLNETN